MTAVALTSLFPPFMDSKEDISIVDYLWGTLFYIAKQLSPSDDYQARFIFLVLEIRKMPAPPGEGRLAFEEGLFPEFLDRSRSMVRCEERLRKRRTSRSSDS